MANQQSYKHSFDYTSAKNEYTFRLRKKRKGCWWLLLLLLLPLLFIRCQHDITVTVIDEKTKEPIPGINVKTRYTSHILLEDGKFFNHSNHDFEDVTDSEGKIVVKDVKSCLLSYIIYAGCDINVTADDAVTVEKPYHYTHNITIEIPGRVTLKFRTIDEETGDLIPRCDLEISTTESGVKTPTSSDTGEFEVRGLRHDEKISITASKTGFGMNNTKIQNAKVDDLFAASQDMRDIPLQMDLPPCSGGIIFEKETEKTARSEQSYNMGVRSGKVYDFIMEINGNGIADHFIVYDGPDADSKVLLDVWEEDGRVNDPNNTVLKNLKGTSSVITVVVETDPNNLENSNWSYKVRCPGP